MFWRFAYNRIPSWGHSPYADSLKQRLEKRYSSRNFQVVVDGLPGDTIVDGSYISPLESRLTNSNRFDWIIVMGGTNDIGWGHLWENIYNALQGVWTEALESGAKVLALTVPASRVCETQRGLQLILDLNLAILSHVEENLWTADVSARLTWPEGIGEQQRVWDDGLHLTPVG